MPLEIIHWRDHVSFHEVSWRDVDDIAELTPADVFSAGWVISEDETKLVIAAHFDRENGTAVGEMCIIKSTIVQRWTLSDPS